PICSDDLTVSAKPGADTPGAPTDRGKARDAHNGAMPQPSHSGPETTAALLAGYLHAAGVRHVFGHPGESILDFMEAARHRHPRRHLRHAGESPGRLRRPLPPPDRRSPLRPLPVRDPVLTPPIPPPAPVPAPRHPPPRPRRPTAVVCPYPR